MSYIALTEAWDPGSAEPGKTYDRCELTNWTRDRQGKEIRFALWYGYVTDGVFIPRRLAADTRIPEPAYTTITSATSSASGEVYADKLEAAILQWALDQSIVAGTIS